MMGDPPAFAASADGTQIAYETVGSGPPPVIWRVGLQMPQSEIEKARQAPLWPHLESFARELS